MDTIIKVRLVRELAYAARVLTISVQNRRCVGPPSLDELRHELFVEFGTEQVIDELTR